MGKYYQLLLQGEKIFQNLRPIMTRQEVGKQLGISGERVRQIELVALAKIAIRMHEVLKHEKGEL